MPIRRVNIPRIDCGDKSGCLSEFVSLIVFQIIYAIYACVVLGIIAAICCGIGSLIN